MRSRSGSRMPSSRSSLPCTVLSPPGQRERGRRAAPGQPAWRSSPALCAPAAPACARARRRLPAPPARRRRGGGARAQPPRLPPRPSCLRRPHAGQPQRRVPVPAARPFRAPVPWRLLPALGHEQRRSRCSLMPTMASPRSSESAGNELGVPVVGHGLHDGRARAWQGRRDLKMPEPTNTPSAPSCIMRAASAGVGHAAGGEVHHGERARLVHLAQQLHGHLQALRLLEQLVVGAGRPRARIWAHVSGACGARPAPRRRCPARPSCGSSLAPSAMRRSASPRSRAPHTNGTAKRVLVDVVHVVGGGEHLALVDVVDARWPGGSAPPRSGRCGTSP